MREHYVYVYLNPLKSGDYWYGKFNFKYEPFYIGMSKDKYRINKHVIISKMNEKYNKKKSFKDNIILKILKNNKEPIRYKLYEELTMESAKRLERFLIKLIGRRDLGLGTLVNHTDGGDVSELTEEIRKYIGRKVSDAWKNGSYDNVDYYWTKGENNHFYGKTHTEETKNKIRESIGDSQKGELNSNYGKNWTDIQKKEASLRQKENHKHLTGDNNPSKRTDVRKNISKSKMGLKNPNGKLWELLSPIGKKYIIEGGIKRNLKKYDLNYQQFENCEVINGYRINKVKKNKGWKLKKL